MSCHAWRMPATLTTQPEIGANIPTLASHRSPEFICPVAKGCLSAVKTRSLPEAICMHSPHGVLMFGVVVSFLWHQITPHLAWRPRCPYGTSFTPDHVLTIFGTEPRAPGIYWEFSIFLQTGVCCPVMEMDV